MRWFVLISIFTACVLAGVALVRDAQRTAASMKAQGRLSQIRLALANYEAVYGVLPARSVLSQNGVALHSWLSLIRPYIDESSKFDSLDLSQAWNSPANATAIAESHRFWNWFTEDGYFIAACDGTDSIWDTDGKPVGRLSDNPKKIVLVAAKINGVHPLEPYVISQQRLRKLLLNGQEVLYIDADFSHGAVILDGP